LVGALLNKEEAEMRAPGISHWPLWANRVAILTLVSIPTAAPADDAAKVVASPRDFIGQKVTVPCLITYAQEASPSWCEVYDSSGQEVGTILFYLINITRDEDRLRATQDCGNQNPRRNKRDRCVATLSGQVGVQFQKAFLTDPTIEWTNK
jgi:hypothetical protein